MPRKTLGITPSAQVKAGAAGITCLNGCLESQRGGSKGWCMSGRLVGATCILSCLAESLLLAPKQSMYDKCHKQVAGTSADIGGFKFRMA